MSVSLSDFECQVCEKNRAEFSQGDIQEGD